MENEFYRQLVLDAPFGYAHHEIILDDAGKPCDYRFIEVNKAFSLLTGIDAEELAGRTVLQVLPDITKDSFDWIQFYGRIALEEGDDEFEHYSKSLDKWYRVQVNSSIKFFFTTLFTDITEDKLAETKLREKTSLLQNITDHMFDVIAMTSLEGIFTYAGPSCRILGFKPEQLTGTAFRDYIHPDDRAYFEQMFSEIIHSPTQDNSQSLEFRHRCADDSWLWLETRGKILLSSDGSADAVFFSSRDINKSKRTEQKLIRERIMLRTIIDSIPDAIYVKDKKCRKLLANKADWANTGCSSEEEVLGKNDFDFFPHEIASKCYNDDQLVFKQEKSIIRKEEKLVKTNGEILWLITTKLPLYNERNEITGLIGIGHNNTDRKKEQEQIKLQNRQLRKLNATRDKIFSIIAHDLRNPFNSILGFSELLMDQINEKDFSSIDEYAEMIHHSSKMALNLLENLLEWARSQTGAIEFKPEYLKLDVLIEETTSLFETLAARKSITISRADPGRKTLFVDKHMIETVLRNLITNAVKFSRPGGRIILSATEEQNHVTISVTDQGVGIHNDRLEKLFSIGHSESTPGTAKEKGSGLGLILCKDFVEKHGGKIWAESILNKGTTFSFTIPAHPGSRRKNQ